MKINKKGIELIKRFEGLYLKAYLCPANVWTIGWGTTVYPDGSKVKSGDMVSEARAEELLNWDLENRYSKHVREANIYPKLKNENEFNALVSFVYNVGRGGLHAPNSINRRIALGENYRVVVETELPRWRNGGGRVLAGLVRRRNDEIALFKTPVATENIQIYFGQVGGEVAQYQKALNKWLVKWGKNLLDTDGIFGNISLSATNDFARNNKEEESTKGVSVSVFDKVMAFAETQEKDKPKYEQPDILTFKRGEDIQLSQNFHLREFTCKCGICENQLVSQKMVQLLQKMREILGVPLFITSAYRCSQHNRNVGGATRSRHLVGDAIDVALGSIDANAFIHLARRTGFTGIGDGRRRGFIHIDLGTPRTWNY